MFTFLLILFFFLLFHKQKNLQHQQQRASLKGLERSPADVSPVNGERQGAHFQDVRGQQGKTSREKNTPGSRRLALARRVFPGCASLETASACASLSLRCCLCRLVLDPLVLLSLPLISAASPPAAWPSPAASVMPLFSPRSARTLSVPSDCLHIHPFMLACSLMAVAGVLPGAR